GGTPLLEVPSLATRVGVGELWVKDEGLNPTGTFKARGASAGVSMARELGVKEIAIPTAGNAGGAWACYGAAAGIRTRVVMPSDAPMPNRSEVVLFGAELMLVEGTIADAGKVVSAGAVEHGWFDASTLREPYRIEGKKTMGLEIAEQLSWETPDAIVYPAGGGVGLIGIWRAFRQLQELGWVDRLPRLCLVQAAGCAPLVRALEAGTEESERWESPATIAQGLRVPKPLGDRLTLRAVRETGGAGVAVEDEQMLSAMETLALSSGILAGPEGAATLAGAIRLRQLGALAAGERVVLVNTGTALKSPDALEQVVASSAEQGGTGGTGDRVRR
ncbi:MAG TPA: threonine synthase, partial [Actinomycetota bacterium]|nr:threonine synthase [Actinomycetota bacterium]